MAIKLEKSQLTALVAAQLAAGRAADGCTLTTVSQAVTGIVDLALKIVHDSEAAVGEYQAELEQAAWAADERETRMKTCEHTFVCHAPDDRSCSKCGTKAAAVSERSPLGDDERPRDNWWSCMVTTSKCGAYPDCRICGKGAQ